MPKYTVPIHCTFKEALQLIVPKDAAWVSGTMNTDVTEDATTYVMTMTLTWKGPGTKAAAEIQKTGPWHEPPRFIERPT